MGVLARVSCAATPIRSHDCVGYGYKEDGANIIRLTIRCGTALCVDMGLAPTEMALSRKNFNVVDGDKFLPVDVYVPGCLRRRR